MADPLANDDPIAGWLRENAVTLRHLEAGNGFDDLQPLNQFWRDVRVNGGVSSRFRITRRTRKRCGRHRG